MAGSLTQAQELAFAREILELMRSNRDLLRQAGFDIIARITEQGKRDDLANQKEAAQKYFGENDFPSRILLKVAREEEI